MQHMVRISEIAKSGMTAKNDHSRKHLPRSTPNVTGSRGGWLCAGFKGQLFPSVGGQPAERCASSSAHVTRHAD